MTTDCRGVDCFDCGVRKGIVSSIGVLMVNPFEILAVFGWVG